MAVVPTFTSCPVEALDAADRTAIIRLCEAAFAESLADLFALAPPELQHLRAHIEGQLVGHACWWPRQFQPQGLPPLTTAYVKMVATDPAWQDRGIGSALMRRLADETTDYQLRALSTVRVTFYERLGWQRWRGPFAVRGDAGTHHQSAGTIMVLPTAQTPPLDRNAPLTGEPGNGGHW